MKFNRCRVVIACITRKSIGYLSLLAVFLMTTGCTTTAMVERAKGYSAEEVHPLKGDELFPHRGVSYVIQQKRCKGENAEEMPPEILQNFPPPYYAFKPCPGAYPFLIVTVPFDAATLPFQAMGVGLMYWFTHSPHE
jgi:hypothetical protein